MFTKGTKSNNQCSDNVRHSHGSRNENAGRQERHTSTLRARFWAKVDRKSDSECWLWTAAKLPAGYGVIGSRGRQFYAHRLSYALAHGAIPVGSVVRHSCDTPACVNPSHLLVGTNRDNVRDALERGRIRGSVSRYALDDADVIAIRASLAKCSFISRAYSVPKCVVSLVRSGRYRRTQFGHLYDVERAA